MGTRDLGQQPVLHCPASARLKYRLRDAIVATRVGLMSSMGHTRTYSISTVSKLLFLFAESQRLAEDCLDRKEISLHHSWLPAIGGLRHDLEYPSSTGALCRHTAGIMAHDRQRQRNTARMYGLSCLRTCGRLDAEAHTQRQAQRLSARWAPWTAASCCSSNENDFVSSAPPLSTLR